MHNNFLILYYTEVAMFAFVFIKDVWLEIYSAKSKEDSKFLVAVC